MTVGKLPTTRLAPISAGSVLVSDCGRDGVHCDVHDAFVRANEAASAALSGASLADVAGGER